MTCPTCDGKGTTELPPHLASTLAVVRSTRNALTADEVLTRMGSTVGVTAIHNRLVDLFLLHLVTRHREGKFWRYSVPVAAHKPRKARAK